MSAPRVAAMQATGTMRGTVGAGRPAGAPAASNAVTIGADDYDMIRREAYSGNLKEVNKADEAEAAIRVARHAASMARAGKWGNTLAALRAGKTAARDDERRAKERAAEELDKIEEEIRLQEKLTLLRHANEYYSGQSDRMKALANYRQRSYDADVDRAQAALKADRMAAMKEREAAFARKINDEVAAASGDEDRRREAARAKAAAITADQKAQLKAVIGRRIAELNEKEAEGRRMMEQIAKINEEANESAQRKTINAAAQQKAFREENVRLKAIRDELKKSEASTMVWIEAQAREKQVMEAKVKEIIDRQRVEAQRKAKIITDLMAADYASRFSAEEERVAKDAADSEAREAREAEEKKRKAAEMRESVLHHIDMVKRKTMERIQAQIVEDKADQDVFVAKLAALEAQEKEDISQRRERAKAYQLLQRAQAADKKRNVEGAMAEDRREAKDADEMGSGGPLDSKFQSAVEKLRNEEIAKGHDTRPLERMVHKMLNPPIMPNLQRV